jgi:hypothetical protein
MDLTLRPGTPADAERCGTICYEAFKAIADRHHFPSDFPSPQAAVASTERRAGFLLPTRNGAVFRWCLEHGLRIVQPMALMSIGLYNEPQRVFLPSIVY